MTDFRKAWLQSMIVSGETAMALRTNGYDWREIATRLQMDVDGARKAAALFLSSDLALREAAAEAAGRAQPQPAPDGSSAGERMTTAAG